MPDSRPSGLVEVLQPELTTLYESIVIPVDDPSYSAVDVKKIKVKTLLQGLNNAIAVNGTAISGINTQLQSMPTNESMATAINNGTALVEGVFTYNATNASGAAIYAYQRNKVVCINGYFNSRGGDGSFSSPLEMAYLDAGSVTHPPKSMYFVASKDDNIQVPCVLRVVGGNLSIGIIFHTDPGNYFFNLTYVV
jgi:hypothetical protein